MKERFTKENYNLQGLANGAYVIVDEKTGVQYLFAYSGYAGGVTLLVDAEGKPLLDPRFRRERI